MIGATKISKGEFYAKGGFSNPRLYRKQRGRSWVYYRRDS